MRLPTLACAAAMGLALGAGGASAEREAIPTSVTSVSGFVQSWQRRILDESLPVADPQDWALRNMPKFAAFSAERLELARQARGIDELEALLVSAPVPAGTRLGTLMDMKPGNISFDALTVRGPVRKATDPGASATLYDDLLFTVLNPCRIFDSRVSQGGSGPFVNGVSRPIKVGPYPAAGGGYATGLGAQGGSASGCGLDTLSAGGGIAAVMVAVSSFAQTGTGYLTFYPNSLPDPSATVVSMFYTLGPVQTAFVLIPTDMETPVWSRGISRGANTELAIDVVGYFESPKALDCVTVAGPDTVIAAASSGSALPASCAAGYTLVANYCRTSSSGTIVAGFNGPNLDNACNFGNPTGAGVTVNNDVRCCRLPGGR